MTAAVLMPAAAEPLLSKPHPKGVVELFTSEGCSSCPPADAVLGRLAADPGIVALAYHVDYWNYLGWRDGFSDRKYTERQYGYARTLGRNGVYTPQAVLDGQAHRVGSDEAGIRRELARLSGSGNGLVVPVTASEQDGQVTISLGSGSGEADVVLVYFDGKDTVPIRAGENGGRTITYWHTVRDVQTVGMWKGRAMRLVMPTPVLRGTSTGGCAILLQRVHGNAPGAIIGAAVVAAKGRARTSP
ncbi:MAG: DUF1223 domain-containing protein [Pararhizobium sp.]